MTSPDAAASLPWYASIRDRPPERPTSEGPESRAGKALFAAVFIAGFGILAGAWFVGVFPLFSEPAHPTSICYGRNVPSPCLPVSASNEWVTVLVDTATLWGGAGLFAYGVVRVLRH